MFLPAEAAASLAAPAAGMHTLSSELLVYRRTIDQVRRRVKDVQGFQGRGLDEQWMGVD